MQPSILTNAPGCRDHFARITANQDLRPIKLRFFTHWGGHQDPSLTEQEISVEWFEVGQAGYSSTLICCTSSLAARSKTCRSAGLSES